MTLHLDRMAIEEAGTDPARLARAIHAQLGEVPAAIPVEAIALALDILDVRVERLTNLEGALITLPERGHGQILVNASRPERQRFTIAHELGHFLSPHHRPTEATGFGCSRADFGTRFSAAQSQHARQEAEANTFAIDLLAPRSKTQAFCAGLPDLVRVLAMADTLKISREAASRRYVEHHRKLLAVVFSHNGLMIYSQSAERFPALAVSRDELVPELPASMGSGPTCVEEADPRDWLKVPNGLDLSVQTLHQSQGWATTLLYVVPKDVDANDDEDEDALVGLNRFPRR